MTPQDCCKIEIDRAFTLVLELARDNVTSYLDSAQQFREETRAIDLVTAYHLLKLKG